MSPVRPRKPDEEREKLSPMKLKEMTMLAEKIQAAIRLKKPIIKIPTHSITTLRKNINMFNFEVMKGAWTGAFKMWGKTGDPYLTLKFPMVYDVDFGFDGIDLSNEELTLDEIIEKVMVNKDKQSRFRKDTLTESEMDSLRKLEKLFFLEEDDRLITFTPKADASIQGSKELPASRSKRNEDVGLQPTGRDSHSPVGDETDALGF
jgi:hypothetical protein